MDIREARQGLAEQLTDAGFSCHDTPPEFVTAPCIVLTPREPWISTDTYRTHTLHLTLSGFLEPGANEVVIEDFEDFLARLFPALGDWGISQIGTPFTAIVNDADLIPCIELDVDLYGVTLPPLT